MKGYSYIELIRSRQRFRRAVASPCYKGGHVISEHLFLAQRSAGTVHLAKPLFLGSIILDLAKVM